MEVCDGGVRGVVLWEWPGAATTTDTIAGGHAGVHALSRLPKLVHEVGSIFTWLPVRVLALRRSRIKNRSFILASL